MASLIAVVVEQLRMVRAQVGDRCARGEHPDREVPSRIVLQDVTSNLIKALFPTRLGAGEFTGSEVDVYVAHTLDIALDALRGEVAKELAFHGQDAAQADSIVRDFAIRLPEIRRVLDTDVDAAYAGDPAARSFAEVLVCYPGVHAVMHFRIAHALHEVGAPFIARIIAELGHAETGIDIHPGAVIGESFFIDHGTGVVVGATAVIGDRVRLYQHVTLGAKKLDGIDRDLPRHPVVEDDVVVYAGATVLGRVTVGRGAVIGGGVWVTQDVVPGSMITQARSMTESFDDGAGI